MFAWHAYDAPLIYDDPLICNGRMVLAIDRHIIHDDARRSGVDAMKRMIQCEPDGRV